MRYVAAIACAFLWFSQPLAAADARDRDECEEVKQKIREIQAKMRRGYSAAQGVKLNEKLLELRERRSKACR